MGKTECLFLGLQNPRKPETQMEAPVDPSHRRFHFVSPLQLLHGVVVASIEVFYDCELLCLDGLLYVISGILAGGSLVSA